MGRGDENQEIQPRVQKIGRGRVLEPGRRCHIASEHARGLSLIKTIAKVLLTGTTSKILSQKLRLCLAKTTWNRRSATNIAMGTHCATNH